MVEIPQKVYKMKISLPVKLVLKAIEKGSGEEVIETTKKLIEGIDWLMEGPWITHKIFQELNGLYRWAWIIKVRAEQALEKKITPVTKTTDPPPNHHPSQCYSFPPTE